MDSNSLWRANLQPASFRGVPFHVRADAKSGGRRLVPFEYPKKDTPYTEDMGRRVRRFRQAAYIIYSPALCNDYQTARDDLWKALEQEGPGVLVHPLMGVDTVEVDHYSMIETQERGGECVFEIEFIEAGTQAFANGTPDTNGKVTTQAQSAANAFQLSSDISGAGAGVVNPSTAAQTTTPPAAVFPGATLPPVFGG